MNDRQNSFETCLGRLLFIDNNNINFLHNWYYLHHYENTLGPLSIIHVGPYVKKGLPPFFYHLCIFNCRDSKCPRRVPNQVYLSVFAVLE